MPWCLYRKSDGVFFPGYADTPDANGVVAQVKDAASFGVLEFSEAAWPNLETERADITSPSKKRSATAGEIVAWNTSRQHMEAETTFIRGLQALAAALFKVQTGAFPNAAQKAALKADFITAWKALG